MAEPIIIDDVDVSGCMYYTTNQKDYTCTCSDYDWNALHCKDNPHCYYKQLQHKTAECEKLKILSIDPTYASTIATLTDTNNRLRQKLQIATEAIREYIKVNCENCEELVEPSCSSCNVADLQQALKRIRKNDKLL